ncbi:MAG: adenylate/guanylate cyclase domain-containing protein [Actinomycetota bacterium]|nr:adenylate/guanylate cyclase domain-containing protein [Actinomycetota bacterium]
MSQTKYALNNGLHIAYQVHGEGDRDLIFISDWLIHVEAMWDIAPYARFLERLPALGRLIVFDMLGTGLSDPMPPGSSRTLEDWMDDMRAVLDAAGSERTALLSFDSAGVMATLFAATYPERTSALVLFNSFARLLRDDELSWGIPVEQRDALLDTFVRSWGTGETLKGFHPNRHFDADELERWGRYERMVMSPGTARSVLGLMLDSDVRDVLPSIRVPTLVLHREGNVMLPPRFGRYLADGIPGARYVGLPGDDHFPFLGDVDALLATIEEFITGAPPSRRGDERVLATILFTDIVGSTDRAAALGDRAWKELLDRHDEIVQRQIARFGGRVVKMTGDGVMGIFDGPTRAISSAGAIRDGVARLDLQVRAGLHTGECERHGDDIQGLAVHIASRVLDQAGPGELMVTSTVKDLVTGSRLSFEPRGSRGLKGVPGEWSLFALI